MTRLRSFCLFASLLAACAARSPASRAPAMAPEDELFTLESRIAVLRAQITEAVPEEGGERPRIHREATPADRPHSDRCRQVHDAAEEICRAAERMCALADQLGSAEPRRRCEIARDDCRSARGVTDECR
jgi:hypothetical protein